MSQRLLAHNSVFRNIASTLCFEVVSNEVVSAGLEFLRSLLELIVHGHSFCGQLPITGRTSKLYAIARTSRLQQLFIGGPDYVFEVVIVNIS